MDPLNCRTAKRIFARYHSAFTPSFQLIFRCRRVVDGSFLDPPAPVWRDGSAHRPSMSKLLLAPFAMITRATNRDSTRETAMLFPVASITRS